MTATSKGQENGGRYGKQDGDGFLSQVFLHPQWFRTQSKQNSSPIPSLSSTYRLAILTNEASGFFPPQGMSSIILIHNLRSAHSNHLDIL